MEGKAPITSRLHRSNPILAEKVDDALCVCRSRSDSIFHLIVLELSGGITRLSQLLTLHVDQVLALWTKGASSSSSTSCRRSIR